EAAPRGDAVDVAEDVDAGEGVQLSEAQRDLTLDGAGDTEAPPLQVAGRVRDDRAVLEHRPLLGEHLAGWQAMGVGDDSRIDRAPAEEAHAVDRSRHPPAGYIGAVAVRAASAA